MEMHSREYNPRDDDDEAYDAAGTADSKKSRLSKAEGEYHSLHHGEGGEFVIKPGVFGRWFEDQPKQDSESDDDDEEDEKTASDATQPASPEDINKEGNAAAVEEQAPPNPTAHYTPDSPTAQLPPVPAMQNERPQPSSQQSIDQTFESIMQSESPAGFAHATSGDLLTDSRPGHVPAIENATNLAEPLHPVSGFDAASERRLQGWSPAGAPENTSQHIEPNVRATFNNTPEPVTGSSFGSGAARLANAVRPVAEAAARTAEGINPRRALAAGFLTGYAVKGFLESRRRKRVERAQQQERVDQQRTMARMQEQLQTANRQINTQGETIAAIQQQQREVPQPSSARPETVYRPTLPGEQPAHLPRPTHEQARPLQAAQQERAMQPRPEIVATPVLGGEKQQTTEAAQAKDAAAAARRAVEEARMAAEEQVREPEQRIEQDAWRRHVVDKAGHDVEGAMQYGNEYEQERAHELMGSNKSAVLPQPSGAFRHDRTSDKASDQPSLPSEKDPLGAFSLPTMSANSGRATASSYLPPALPSRQSNRSIASGLTPTDHSLPAGLTIDTQHRLSDKKQSVVVAALTSPWLFLMLSLILLAYFIASLL